MSNLQAVLVSLALVAVLLSHQPNRDTDGPAPLPVGTLAGTASGNPQQSRPPTPPILETFDAAPQLSLFPRLGDYRPEDTDKDRLPYWRSYLEHLQKISGVVKSDPTSGNRIFAFRTINGLDSVGFFSPIAVEPNTAYRVSCLIKAELPEGGSTGLGIIEFDRFLWLGEQYPQSIDDQHRTGSQDGIRLTESTDRTEQTFTFTSGPNTAMVHLVLFREGEANRKPVMVDDISIEKVE